MTNIQLTTGKTWFIIKLKIGFFLTNILDEVVKLRAFNRWKSVVCLIWMLFSIRALWIVYFYRSAFSNMASIEDRFEVWCAVIVWCFLMIVYISLCVIGRGLLESKQETDQINSKLRRHIKNEEH